MWDVLSPKATRCGTDQENFAESCGHRLLIEKTRERASETVVNWKAVEVLLIGIALLVSLLAGDWAYWKIRGESLAGPWLETRARIVAGLATAAVCGALFAALGVHKYFGIETPWTFSIFLGVCGGICEGVLYRGRLLERFHSNAQRPPANDA